jgi:threonylcarbamoyladenosine tRNA methylthiotransferase MtaB
MDRQKTVAAFTLGCRLNQADTALIFDRLKQAGYSIVPLDFPELDVLIVNSCTVTATAARKSRQAVRRFKRKHPTVRVVFTGCGTELDSMENDPVIDIVLKNNEKKDIVTILNSFDENGQQKLAANSSPVKDEIFYENACELYPFRSRAFLKIQEGCNSFCSYCIVPYVRGRERSRDWQEIVDNFKRLVEQGYREIVLTGVNVCKYNYQGKGLAQLLAELTSINGVFRIRLSSTEPDRSNYELLEVMRENQQKICRFLHLPLQHGTDKILKDMNRTYTTEEFAGFVDKARTAIPDIHIGSDIILGFPGETEALFKSACEFVAKMAFANLHIFTFSPREGTPAASMKGQVAKTAARKRYNIMEAINRKNAIAFAENQFGKPLDVLFESKSEKKRCYEGWSDNYLKVTADSESDIRGEIKTVKIKEITEERITGKIIYQNDK